MVSRKQSVLAGVAVLLSQTLGEDLAQSTAELAGGCQDIIQDTTLCTEGGHCDCEDYVAANPCGQLADIAVDDIMINADRSKRCERHQLITDLTRIAAHIGEPMIAKCNVLEEAIEKTGKPPIDNKVSCGCLALIPEDEMPGMMNCMINDKYHGWHAHTLCKSILQGRRRMVDGLEHFEDGSWDAETDRRLSLTVEEAEEEVNADPELLAAYEDMLEETQTERRRQFVRESTWRNILTSGSIYHGGEYYEAWQSGVCNATCGLCDVPVAPTPLADLPPATGGDMDLVDGAVNDVEMNQPVAPTPLADLATAIDGDIDLVDGATNDVDMDQPVAPTPLAPTPLADLPTAIDGDKDLVDGATNDEDADEDEAITVDFSKMGRKERKKARKAKKAAKAAAKKAEKSADAADPMRRLYEAIRRLI